MATKVPVKEEYPEAQRLAERIFDETCGKSGRMVESFWKFRTDTQHKQFKRGDAKKVKFDLVNLAPQVPETILAMMAVENAGSYFIQEICEFQVNANDTIKATTPFMRARAKQATSLM